MAAKYFYSGVGQVEVTSPLWSVWFLSGGQFNDRLIIILTDSKTTKSFYLSSTIFLVSVKLPATSL